MVPSTFDVCSLNVNGLRSADRRGLRAWLDARRPDVFCLQEVRAQEADVAAELWRPAGWETAWFPAEKKGYAGTAVWSRHGGRFEVGLGHPRADAEGRAVGVSVGGLEVWSVYLPSGSAGPDRQAWKDEFLGVARAWLDARRGRPALVCGDLNIAHQAIDLKNWRGNQKNSGFLPHERTWMGELLASGWVDTFRHVHPTRAAYSWWSQRGQARANDVGWRIDYVLASPGVRVIDAGIERDVALSDHAPVWARVEVAPEVLPCPAP